MQPVAPRVCAETAHLQFSQHTEDFCRDAERQSLKPHNKHRYFTVHNNIAQTRVQSANCAVFSDSAAPQHTSCGPFTRFWTRKAGPKSYSSCSSSCCCCQFFKGPKIPKTFLLRSRAQRNFAYIFVLTLPTDLPSQICNLYSN